MPTPWRAPQPSLSAPSPVVDADGPCPTILSLPSIRREVVCHRPQSSTAAAAAFGVAALEQHLPCAVVGSLYAYLLLTYLRLLSDLCLLSSLTMKTMLLIGFYGRGAAGRRAGGAAAAAAAKVRACKFSGERKLAAVIAPTPPARNYGENSSTPRSSRHGLLNQHLASASQADASQAGIVVRHKPHWHLSQKRGSFRGARREITWQKETEREREREKWGDRWGCGRGGTRLFHFFCIS